jgi:non-specific serine/threonine protein kinase
VSREQELAPGTQLAGYRILRLVGRGGTGLVYEAEHVVLGRTAALKTLVPDLVDDLEFRERLVRESRMVAALDHPAVIPIYDAGESDGRLYVAMRFVRGVDLAVLLTRERRLDLATTLGVLEQVAGGLDAAHASALVHRDVKPANVLLEEATGRVYLTDFGIAKQADSAGLTRTGFFLGTVESAAPEQIQGLPVGPPADVYAFGCTLYECLTGRPPFDHGSAAATLRAHLFDPPPALSADLGLDAAVDAVIARALAKKESERHTTCGEVIAELKAALGGRRETRSWTALRRARTGTDPRAPLPVHTRPLFGREQELERLEALLRDADMRLVTLVGLSGVGKTRLAVAAAHQRAGDFDRIVFVDVTGVSDQDECVRAIADAVGAGDEGDERPEAAIASALGDRRTLLVVDGFERVEGGPELLAKLLTAAPRTLALVTSQRALRLREERRFPVPPLPLPDAADAGDPDRLGRSPAVALFVDEAVAVNPRFELTPENAGAVTDICIRVDGLPLAIELAAARVDLLTPQAIRERLEGGLALLASDAPTRPERQRTLSGAIETTRDLLVSDERELLTSLAVFPGSWSLEAAVAVCGVPERSGGLLTALASLIDKGLIHQEEDARGEPRFTMLRTVRDHALQQLADRGELETVRGRHLARYVALAEAAEPELYGPGQLVWLTRLREEEPDIWAALQWASEDDGDLGAGLRLAGAVARYWSMRGPVARARGWLTEALAAAHGVAPAVIGRAELAAGSLAACQGELRAAVAHLDRAFEIAHALGDAHGEAAALALIARLQLASGETIAARAAAEQSLELAEPARDKATAVSALGVLADLTADAGDDAGAERLSQRGLSLCRELGDRSLLATSLIELARRSIARREDGRTAAWLQEGLTLARQVEDAWLESLALATSGALSARADDTAEARRLVAAALAIAYARGDQRTVAECVHVLAAVAALDGDGHRAARLAGAAETLRSEIGAERSTVERALEEPLALAAGEAVDVALDVENAAGGLLGLDEIVRLALEGTPVPSTA